MSDNVSGVENNESKGAEENVVEQPNQEVEHAEAVACEVCAKKDDVRIVLRQCGHVVCVPCALEYIKNRIIIDGHPRFKCPLSTCNQVVHENDINALLDEKEPALEQYMPIGHRRYLQHKQHKHSIMAALPSSDIKRCPLCRSIYMHEAGCNYVICANSACATAFCWQCEKPIGRPITHYTTASKCRLGYTDYERILRCVQLILDVNFVLLWVFFPLVYLVAFIYIPVILVFLIPITLAYEAYRKETDSHDFLVPTDYLVIIVRVLIGLVIGVLVSVPMAIGSIVSGFLLVAVYLGFVVIRTIPCGLSGDRVSSVLCWMRWVGRLLRIGPYGKLLEDARRERRDALVKLEENQDDFENAISEAPVLASTMFSLSSPEPVEAAVNCSKYGWMSQFENPEDWRDITDEANITLSTAVEGSGVDELLHDSVNRIWRTNERLPHRATLLFNKLTDVTYVILYLDWEKDESYCPEEILVQMGSGTNNWSFSKLFKTPTPKGWTLLYLSDNDVPSRRVMSLQLTIHRNHQGGKDCIIRHLRVIAPSRNQYCAMERLILGTSTDLASLLPRDTYGVVMNNFASLR